MCGRFSIFTPLEELKQRFGAEPPDETVSPRYNAAPGQKLIVIPMDDPKKMYLYKWGLIPRWSKDEMIGYKLINARAETIGEKPAFRGSLQKERCLVLADGFYEWRESAGKKTPYRIELKGCRPFAMAGLYSRWKGEKGAEIDTFAIITTGANNMVAPIHNRMPVILSEGSEKKWLDPSMDLTETDRYMAPYSGGDMEMYPVSALVNSPKNDMAEIVRPVW